MDRERRKERREEVDGGIGNNSHVTQATFPYDCHVALSSFLLINELYGPASRLIKERKTAALEENTDTLFFWFQQLPYRMLHFFLL